MSLDFYLEETKPTEIYWKNVTHNLCPMWRKADIFDDLYESDGKKASEILDNLKVGLEKMLGDVMGYTKLNPENGWGDYNGAIDFLTETIKACEESPQAIIRISA